MQTFCLKNIMINIVAVYNIQGSINIKYSEVYEETEFIYGVLKIKFK